MTRAAPIRRSRTIVCEMRRLIAGAAVLVLGCTTPVKQRPDAGPVASIACSWAASAPGDTTIHDLPVGRKAFQLRCRARSPVPSEFEQYITEDRSRGAGAATRGRRSAARRGRPRGRWHAARFRYARRHRLAPGRGRGPRGGAAPRFALRRPHTPILPAPGRSSFPGRVPSARANGQPTGWCPGLHRFRTLEFRSPRIKDLRELFATPGRTPNGNYEQFLRIEVVARRGARLPTINDDRNRCGRT